MRESGSKRSPSALESASVGLGPKHNNQRASESVMKASVALQKSLVKRKQFAGLDQSLMSSSGVHEQVAKMHEDRLLEERHSLVGSPTSTLHLYSETADK